MKICQQFLILVLIISCSEKKIGPAMIEAFHQKHQKALEKNKKNTNKILTPSFDFHGIELIYVQSGKTYYSWLGHILIRFVGSNKDPKNDLSISFIADFNDYALDIPKAYYGGYTILPVIKPFKDFLSDYTIKEDRYIDRFIVPTSKKERASIKKSLKLWVEDPKTPGTYSFKTNNCATLALKLLQEGVKEISPSSAPFPIEVVQHLKKVRRISYNYSRINRFNIQNEQSKTLSLKDYQIK